MEFQYPHILFALLGLPLIALLWFLMSRWKKRALQKFGDIPVVMRLIPDHSGRRPVFKFIIFLTALACVILGMANLRIGSKLEKVSRQGVDVIICLDISNSMRAQDIKPDRLERASMAISRFIDRMKNDQIGIIVFAGRAQTQLPVTPDHAAAKMLVHTISTDNIQVQGTAIGAALELAENSFNLKSRPRKVIILISDGENHEDDALAAAQEIGGKGIIIHTIGMGSPEGAPIPVKLPGRQTEFKKDRSGNTVISRLDENMLRQIAAAGNGTYTRATTNEVGLNRIYNEIEKLEKRDYEAMNFTDYENLYPYFIGFAFFLLILEVFIFARKSKLTRNLKLFSKSASEYVTGNDKK
jgi:Ca-activated chloride channel homolog